MMNLTTDRELTKELRQKGLERAKIFSWDACAAKTFTLIKEL